MLIIDPVAAFGGVMVIVTISILAWEFFTSD